ncbi:thioredoxin [Bacillus sp. HMF5848]|uniref:thioredoxin family protein n=1 Tax=Bacillus sp. HMF5848 TaxID=2495421 RepID=UPI000F78E0CD|nr:thioredoxin family protein [Bacillus sp. HMF5848]RSK28212.1 thioredoxin [Bacillus sp. HMF5848]
MKELQSIEQYNSIINEKVILLFSAQWCPDCRVIEPFLSELEEEFAAYDFYYVDRDQFIDLCQQLDVFGIPSFIAFENSNELGRFVSKDRKTKEEIQQFIRGLKE